MLPVLEIEDRIADHLRRGNRLVLTAPTGSGKTTQVPQILLRGGGMDGRIVVLQPRRLAARMMAHRVAHEMGCAVGDIVGYQTRHDSKISDRSRIRFVTEGIFLRQLQSSPDLDGVGAVILDEFHERNLASDMALGLVRRLQESHRPDLRLIVMSATLDASAVSTYLNCPAVSAEGRVYPVEIAYLPAQKAAPPWDLAANALRAFLDRNEPGDILIFMPGAYEIRRTVETCRRQRRPSDGPISFFPLHGSLPARQQDAAVGPCPDRKVIVATNVAETSITIDGIRHVIDSGLARVHRHDVRRGINVLLVESISRAAADQRAGRAGRTAPGSCARLWPHAEHDVRPAHGDPEIRRLDLAECVLQLNAMNVEDVRAFPWLEPPEDTAVERASALLIDLGACDSEGGLTPLGRTMADLPMHPRLSRVVVEAGERGCLERATLWASLIGARDILLRPLRAQYTDPIPDDYQSDLVVQERAFRQAQAARFSVPLCAEIGVHAAACREVGLTAALYRQTCRRMGLSLKGPNRTEDLLKCLLMGFFDHVATRRGAAALTCAMPGQSRVVLDGESVARHAEEAGFIVALDVRERITGGEIRTILSLASEIEREWLERCHPDRIAIDTNAVWNPENRAVEQVETHSFNGLVYHRIERPDADPADAADILVDRIRQGDLKLGKWNDKVDAWIARVRCVSEWFPERGVIAYDEDDLRVVLYEIVAGATRYSQIRSRPCLHIVQNALSWPDRQFVEQMTPEHIRLPCGRRMRIDYRPGEPPCGRARIQDLYGQEDTPRVAGGRQKLRLEILAPNFRPAQVTDDLKGFWQRTYPELKKELRRRYPKHEWR